MSDDADKIEETASDMAWTINDELWETASEHRREFWREMALKTILALMLPSAAKKVALDEVHKRIADEGLT